MPGAGLEPACLAAEDFKSSVSADFTTRAAARKLTRRRWGGYACAVRARRAAERSAARFCATPAPPP